MIYFKLNERVIYFLFKYMCVCVFACMSVYTCMNLVICMLYFVARNATELDGVAVNSLYTFILEVPGLNRSYVFSYHDCSVEEFMMFKNYSRLNCQLYRGADKSLARPGRKQATVTEGFDVHISYL